MKKITINGKPIELNWHNVLFNHSHRINRIDQMAKAAIILGYPLILWNDRIYSVHDHDQKEEPTDFSFVDTTFVKSDIS